MLRPISSWRNNNKPLLMYCLVLNMYLAWFLHLQKMTSSPRSKYRSLTQVVNDTLLLYLGVIHISSPFTNTSDRLLFISLLHHTNTFIVVIYTNYICLEDLPKWTIFVITPISKSPFVMTPQSQLQHPVYVPNFTI